MPMGKTKSTKNFTSLLVIQLNSLCKKKCCGDVPDFKTLMGKPKKIEKDLHTHIK